MAADLLLFRAVVICSVICLRIGYYETYPTVSNPRGYSLAVREPPVLELFTTVPQTKVRIDVKEHRKHRNKQRPISFFERRRGKPMKTFFSLTLLLSTFNLNRLF